MEVFFCGPADGLRHYNADAIVDAFQMGWLDDDVSVLDVCFGLGRFWTKRRPKGLVGVDLNPNRSELGRPVDARATGFDDDSWDRVVVDGPYQYSGTADGDQMKEDYGVTGLSPNQVDATLIAMMDEALRIVKPGGLVLFKSMDQTVSGSKRWQVRTMENHWEGRGHKVLDRLGVRSYRPQPSGRRQATVRSDQSILSILQKRKPRRKVGMS